MIAATVKRWSPLKGFGFLTVADDKRDIFVHYRAFPKLGGKRLDLIEGQCVWIDAVKLGPKGPFADCATINDPSFAPTVGPL